MKREDRRQAIVDLLVEAREIELDDLARRFAVSRMTIHRDLDDLEQSGLLKKVRGRATIEAGMQMDSDFRIREMQDAEAKARLAETALALVRPGMTVMINDGSMAAALGGRMAERAPLTVITNNAAILERLRDAGRVVLISLGGTYSAKFNGFFGRVTEDTLARLRADLAFISTPAVAGLTAYHMDDDAVRAKQAMMRAASRSVLMVNHARFGRTALHAMADLSEFDTILTDAAPGPDHLAALERAGLTLTVAGEGGAAQ